MEKPHQQVPQFKSKDRAEHRKLARSRFGFSRSSSLFKLLTILGPGLIAANAGNDAGGIATFASAGANYGYNLLWALAIAGFCLAIVQEMCAPDLTEVDDASIATLIVVDMGCVKIAVCKPCLFIGIEPAIEALHNSPGSDLLQVQRLKKRKLHLRDRIIQIEDQLTPDIIA